jgi:hypothetical protein
MLVNSGLDIVSRELGGDGQGYTGTATASSATSITATGTPFTASAFIGHIVVAGSVFGVITANTTSVLTVDQWYNPASIGGAAGSTPGSTSTFVVLPGNAPAPFMAISTTNSAPSATDTSLGGEVTTAGSGLVRQLASYTHTAGATTYTLTATFTATGSASFPTTVYRIGVFNSNVAGGTTGMAFETSLSAAATFNASGDALTVTETVTV